jgi:hypothetical protein
VLVPRNDRKLTRAFVAAGLRSFSRFRCLRGLRLLTESRALYEDGPLLLEAERTAPAAYRVHGDAMEAAGSPNRRSRRLHYVSMNRDDFSGLVRSAED